MKWKLVKDNTYIVVIIIISQIRFYFHVTSEGNFALYKKTKHNITYIDTKYGLIQFISKKA